MLPQDSLSSGDLIEEVCRFVHTILADVDVVLTSPLRAPLAVRVQVEHPAGPHHTVQRHDLVAGDTEHLILKELAVRLMERLVRADVQVAEREPFTAERGK